MFAQLSLLFESNISIVYIRDILMIICCLETLYTLLLMLLKGQGLYFSLPAFHHSTEVY